MPKTFLSRLTLESSIGMKYAYIDCDSNFTYEACNDIQNIDGRFDQTDYSSPSLQGRGFIKEGGIMFDLENAIKKWKKNLQKYEVFEDGLTADIELHLRDAYDGQRKAGLDEEAAFRMAVAQVGTADSIASEYSKNRLVMLNRRSPL